MRVCVRAVPVTRKTQGRPHRMDATTAPRQ